jgi:hypothetical protein
MEKTEISLHIPNHSNPLVHTTTYTPSWLLDYCFRPETYLKSAKNENAGISRMIYDMGEIVQLAQTDSECKSIDGPLRIGDLQGIVSKNIS